MNRSRICYNWSGRVRWWLRRLLCMLHHDEFSMDLQMEWEKGWGRAEQKRKRKTGRYKK
jgi:hypothetical protein